MCLKFVKEFKSKQIKICYFKGRKFLIFNSNGLSYYKELPKGIIIEKNSLLSTSFKLEPNNYSINQNIQDVDIFFKHLDNIEFLYRKKLILKGLGLKANFGSDRKFLDLKLGYSHLSKVKMDKEVKVGIQKNNLFFSSLNKVKLGNLAFKIKKLRLPNPYKGKGIWYKNERITLKEIKKK